MSDERTSKELLPCPFCGSRAELRDEGPPWFVYCVECDADGAWMDTQAKATEHWNKRHSHEPSEQRCERHGFHLVGRCPGCVAEGAIRAALPPGAWQPIATAPRNGTRILLAANVHAPDGKPRIGSGHYSTDPWLSDNDEVIGAEEGFQSDGDDCIPSNQECFTHWAPIPAFTLTKAAALPCPVAGCDETLRPYAGCPTHDRPAQGEHVE